MTRRALTGPALPLELRPIGFVRSPHRVHHDAGRQPGTGKGQPGEIHIAQGLQNCLADLDGFSHVWVLFWFHHARGFNAKVKPPRDTAKRGLFATRAPQRPNPIGLSCVELLSIERRIVHIGDHDLLDGTPVLDLKPYLPYCDARPDARIGYVATLPADAGDHETWWQQKGLPMPRVYRSSRGPGPNDDDPFTNGSRR